MFTTEQMKTATREIEKTCATYLGNEIEALRKTGGDKLANELLLSVNCLLMSRSIAIMHVWTGEPIDAIRKRVNEVLDHNIKATVIKQMQDFAKQGGA